MQTKIKSAPKTKATAAATAAPAATPTPAEKPQHAHAAIKLHYTGASKQRNANRKTEIKLRNSGGLTDRTFDLLNALKAEYKTDGFVARGLDNKICAFLINGGFVAHIAGTGKLAPDADSPAHNVITDAPGNPAMLQIIPESVQPVKK